MPGAYRRGRYGAAADQAPTPPDSKLSAKITSAGGMVNVPLAAAPPLNALSTARRLHG